LMCCSPMRSVHRGNGVNDEQNREDTLTSAVLQEALVNMPLSVIWKARLRALPSGVLGLCRYLILLRSIQYRPR
jgi:hypothetical protein